MQTFGLDGSREVAPFYLLCHGGEYAQRDDNRKGMGCFLHSTHSIIAGLISDGGNFGQHRAEQSRAQLKT